MKRVKLTRKAEELLESIPDDYLDVLVSTLIVRSAQNGVLMQEAMIYLTDEELEALSEKAEATKAKRRGSGGGSIKKYSFEGNKVDEGGGEFVL